ncbi:MAG: methyltransferase domain-containing protein [Actinomycetota bacterium]
MRRAPTEEDRENQNARRRRVWDKKAPGYDKEIGWFERHVLGLDNRSWACARAQGQVLEVAVGTGLNIPLYHPDVRLSAIDLSSGMLEIARQRVAALVRPVNLCQADAHELPFADEAFDSVVCTFSLCNIPDIARAVAEMYRVLKPGGRLVLVDHIRSANILVYAIQKAIEFLSVRIDGDHMTRRPLDQVRAQGFEILEDERYRLGGIIERLVARKS